MGSVYILSVKVPSLKAKRLHGYGWVWKHRAKFRTRPPDSANALFQWFYPRWTIEASKSFDEPAPGMTREA